MEQIERIRRAVMQRTWQPQGGDSPADAYSLHDSEDEPSRAEPHRLRSTPLARPYSTRAPFPPSADRSLA